MPKNKYSIYLLVILAVIFWGLSYVWMSIVLQYYRPVTTMFLRLCLSSVLLIILLKLTGKSENIRKEDYLSFVLLSFFSPFCYFLGESFGLMLVSPTVAAVIIATIPVFTPLLAYIAFRERITIVNVFGFFISFSGVVIMVLDFEFRFSASPLGVFLLFCAVFSALINMIFLKKLAFRYSSMTIIKTQNVLGAAFFLPLFLIYDFQHFAQVRPTFELVTSLLQLAVFASTMAFVFYTIAFRTIGIARTSIFTNLIPVCTAVFSYILLKESIDSSKIIGMFVVISGVFLTQITRYRKIFTGKSENEG